MSLILAMVGRTQALADCEGDGVETLRSRAIHVGGVTGSPRCLPRLETADQVGCTGQPSSCSVAAARLEA